MKTVAVVMLGLVGVVGGLSAGSPAEAFEYLGDICWSYVYTYPTASSGVLRLGVSHLGGGHYLLGGVGSQTLPTVQQAPLQGSAEFIGESIELTLTMSDSVSNLPSAAASVSVTPASSVLIVIYHALLDPLTLNGSFWGVATEAIPVAVGSGYLAGTLTRIACP